MKRAVPSLLAQVLWAPLVGATLGLPSAMAQEDPVEVGGGTFDFDLNSVLVASFEADQAFLESESDRVRRLVEGALGSAYVVVKMAEVPAFTDYSAEIYLRSCPQGQYIGCVFVVGGRAQTDWTIGGRVSAVEGGYQVDLSFIDVSDAKLVLEFDVVLDGSNDAEFKEGVQRIMDALVNGEVADLDVRRDPEAERAAAAEAERRAKLQQEFSEDSRYEDPEDFRRGEVGLDAYVGGEDDLGGDESGDVRSSGSSTGKVSASDLQAMEEKGGLPPWERAGLTKTQYRIYRNSGKKLRDFKAVLQGRKGEVLIKGSLNVGQGPWGQVHDTQFVIDNQANVNNLQPGDILAEYDAQFLSDKLAIGGTFELGYGLAPWFELTVHGGIKSAPYQWRVQPFVENVDKDGDVFTTNQVVPWFAGLRLGLVPMPAFPARPTLHIGGSYMVGSSFNKLVQVPTFLLAAQAQPAAMIVAHINPGVDINAGKWVSVWARLDLDVLVASFNSSVQCVRDPREPTNCGNAAAAALFPSPPAGAQPFGRIGIGGSVGLTARIRVAGMR